jgi:membrane-bound lytic murein transglycosylase B
MVRLVPVLAVLVTLGVTGCSGATTPTPAGPAPASSQAQEQTVAPRAETDLAARIEQTDRTIADPSSPPDAVRRAGELQQLASRTLAASGERARRRVMSALHGRAAAVMTADITAATGLKVLTEPQPTVPANWRIVAPLAPRDLLRIYHAAQRRSGVPWQYLAAVNFVESKFGRIVGPSTAGAQGPMQFMPPTFAEYGAGGDIHDPQDAIPAAARMLAANGAPGDMAGALRAYNDSPLYVRAVTAYARVMQRWPRAFLGYWSWRVLYQTRHGVYVLPVGYPRVPAARLTTP